MNIQNIRSHYTKSNYITNNKAENHEKFVSVKWLVIDIIDFKR